MNNVNLIGRIGRDPEIKETPTSKVAKFSLAIDGGKDKPPEWIDIETWGKQAEFVGNYLAKGRKIALTGRLKVDKWQDKESGQNRSKIKVVANFIEFADSKPANNEQPAQQTEAQQPSLDDIPF